MNGILIDSSRGGYPLQLAAAEFKSVEFKEIRELLGLGERLYSRSIG
jgi:hypothetical protein